MQNRCLLLVALCLTAVAAQAGTKAPKSQKPPQETPLDVYVRQANEHAASAAAVSSTTGSTWSNGGLLTDLARDTRAAHVDDLVTIVVAETASAVAKGTTKTKRESAANNSITALLKKTPATGALANLASLSGTQSLTGDGATSRNNTVTATVSARVVGVLPNGYLVLEGTKNVVVNSENQLITVRGVARPTDVSPANMVRSDRLAQLEVKINGKGVVNDAIRRPFFLYRLLLGLLPF